MSFKHTFHFGSRLLKGSLKSLMCNYRTKLHGVTSGMAVILCLCVHEQMKKFAVIKVEGGAYTIILFLEKQGK